LCNFSEWEDLFIFLRDEVDLRGVNDVKLFHYVSFNRLETLLNFSLLLVEVQVVGMGGSNNFPKKYGGFKRE
jgi:hypothetical protein